MHPYCVLRTTTYDAARRALGAYAGTDPVYTAAGVPHYVRQGVVYVPESALPLPAGYGAVRWELTLDELDMIILDSLGNQAALRQARMWRLPSDAADHFVGGYCTEPLGKRCLRWCRCCFRPFLAQRDHPQQRYCHRGNPISLGMTYPVWFPTSPCGDWGYTWQVWVLTRARPHHALRSMRESGLRWWQRPGAWVLMWRMRWCAWRLDRHYRRAVVPSVCTRLRRWGKALLRWCREGVWRIVWRSR